MKFRSLQEEKIHDSLERYWKDLAHWKRYNASDVKARNKKPNVHGFDLETDKNGDCFLISISTEKGCFSLTQEEGANNTFKALEFLYKHNCHHTLNFGFNNLPFDTDAIFKEHLCSSTKKQARAFYDRIQEPDGIYILDPENPASEVFDAEFADMNADEAKRRGIKFFNVRFIKGKFLSISKAEGNPAIFYDAHNFMFGSLDKNVQSIFGKSKESFGVSDSQVDIENLSEKPVEIQKLRCETDAKFTRWLGEWLRDTVHEWFGFYPRKWNSAASLAESILINTIDEKFLKPFHKESNIDNEVLEYFFRAFFGGLFVAFVKGKAEYVSEVDLKGAYSNNALTYPDMTFGSWEHVQRMRNDPKIFWGVYHVKMNFDGYTPYRPKRGSMIYPAKTKLRDNYVVKPQLEYLLSKGVQLEIVDGYEFMHDESEPVYFLRPLIEKLLKIKNETDSKKEPNKYTLVKLILECCSYGKHAQSKDGLGLIFNPAIASYATALTRVKIQKVASQFFKVNEVYELATDAAIGQLKDEYAVLSEDELDKRLLEAGLDRKVRKCPESHEPVKNWVFIQTGLTADERGHIFRNRGISAKVSEKMNPNAKIDFKKKEMVMTVKRPIHAGEATKVGHITVDGKKIPISRNDINKFLEVEKHFKYNDGKRIWDNDKITKENLFANLIRSKPLNEGFLETYEEYSEEQSDEDDFDPIAEITARLEDETDELLQ